LSSRNGASGKVRCAIYTRKSSEEGLQQHFNSLHAQREACEAYVLSQAGEGWSALPTIYDDGGFSGGNMERPALSKLLADVDAGQIDVVVVYKVDRLTRALTDFAKIVERFDARGVSFVSVTQAFNTTNSLGRLTLNVLLSFAQFERELTGERIRDKIAASKAKGIWMGGPPPLGYDAKDRALVVNNEEAATVVEIFRSYLAAGSVHTLRRSLEARGVRSKTRVSRQGLVTGGEPFSRGALFHLLTNRLYVGEIVHKTNRYPGRHTPIVDHALFDDVQAMLAKSVRRRSSASATVSATWLTGRIFDDRGNIMSPATTRRRGCGYRYYVSAPLQVGERQLAGSLPRFPAMALEDLVNDRVGRLSGVIGAHLDTSEVVRRIEVSRDQVIVDLNVAPKPAQARRIARLLPPIDSVEVLDGGLRLTLSAALRPKRGAKLLLTPDGMPAVARRAEDPTLIQALVRAEAWKHHLLEYGSDSLERLHRSEGVDRSYARRLIRIAFLSPALKRAILDGAAPPDLTVQNLKRGYLPLYWSDQDTAYRRPA